MYDYDYPRTLEKSGKWNEAAQAWRTVRSITDANACQLIADSIEAGDRLREKDRTTVYTVFETIRGNFGYSADKEPIKSGYRLIGYVYGISEAVCAVTSLRENKEDLQRVVTGIKMDFPELNS